MHRFRRRRILDQLEHTVPEHDLTRRGGDVFAHGEGVLIGQRHQNLTAVGLNIAHEVFQTFDKALALGLNRALQGLGVRAQEIGRGHHVDDLLGEIFQPLAIARL